MATGKLIIGGILLSLSLGPDGARAQDQVMPQAAFKSSVDLVRIAAIVRDSGLAAARGTASPAWNVMLRGVRVALSTSRASLGRATLGWTGRAVVGLALLAIGYVAADELGGRGGLSLALLFGIHQAVVLGRVALRASWMARALALVAPVQDER